MNEGKGGVRSQKRAKGRETGDKAAGARLLDLNGSQAETGRTLMEEEENEA